MNFYILDENNKPIPATMDQWSKWIESNDDRRVVARTDFRGHVISTVFLSIDHSFDGGNPVLFETMVFSQHPKLEDQMQRYCTYDQALNGHTEMVSYVNLILEGDK